MVKPADQPQARSRVRRIQDCAYQVIEGETLIVRPRDRQLHLLNETGSALWNWMESILSVDDLVDRLCAEFEVEASEARTDVLAFLETLRERGLVEVK